MMFVPLKCGEITLEHRVVMAPLTRMRAAEPTKSPWEIQAEYYGQRASKGGLLIAEATQVDQNGQGYPSTPGIYTKEHMEGWKMTTDAVHAKGGYIFLQLWHVGRVSHSFYQRSNTLPLSASNVKMKGRILTPEGMKEPENPQPIHLEDIPSIVSQYARSAQLAKEAGFDGVEVHAANGYLLDQFHNNQVNLRTDAYGGSVENRSRLTMEVMAAVCAVFGEGRVGIRLSPHEGVGPNDARDSNPEEVYTYLVKTLSAKYGPKLSYLHLIETTRSFGTDKTWAMPGDDFKMISKYRHLFNGTVIAASGFTPAAAEEFVAKKGADAVAFGRLFISTPDLPDRIRSGALPNKYTRKTFYTMGTAGQSKNDLEDGYTNYPTLENAPESLLLDFDKLMADVAAKSRL